MEQLENENGMSFFYFGECMNVCMNSLPDNMSFFYFYVYFILFSGILINFAIIKHTFESNVNKTRDNNQKLRQKIQHSFIQ